MITQLIKQQTFNFSPGGNFAFLEGAGEEGGLRPVVGGATTCSGSGGCSLAPNPNMHTSMNTSNASRLVI